MLTKQMNFLCLCLCNKTIRICCSIKWLVRTWWADSGMILIIYKSTVICWARRGGATQRKAPDWGVSLGESHNTYINKNDENYLYRI